MRNQTERITNGINDQSPLGVRNIDGKYVISKLKMQVSSDTQTFSQLNDQSHNNLATPMSNNDR